MRGARFLPAVALGLAATSQVAPAQDADRLFQVPAGCDAFLTVQSRGCVVGHHWTCDADPEGTRWRVTVDPDGPFHLSFTDGEFRWLRSWDLRGQGTDTLVEPEDDPASLTELFARGSDSMVFSILREGPGGTERRDYTGFDRLTGEEIVVDGRPLLVTEFAYQYDTADGVRRTRGNQFVHRGWRMFFGGIEPVSLPDGESFEGNYSPMEFAEPGEPGFLDMQPLYDCGDIMSALDAPRRHVRQSVPAPLAEEEVR